MADVGAALGHLRHRLVCLVHVLDQGVDLATGPAQGLLGPVDMVSGRFRLLRRLLGVTRHADRSGAHLVHGTDHALQLQALFIQAAAHGISRLLHAPCLLVYLLANLLAALHHGPQFAEEGIEVPAELDELLVGIYLHLLGQIPLIAGEVGDVSADEGEGGRDGLNEPDEQSQCHQGDGDYGHQLLLLGGLQQAAKLVADGVGLTEGEGLGHLDHQPPLAVGGVDLDGLLQDEVAVAIPGLAIWRHQSGLRQGAPQLVRMAVAADDKAHLADQGHLGLIVIQTLAEVLGQLLEDGQVHVDPGDPGKLAPLEDGDRQAGHQHLLARAYLVEVGLHQAGAQAVTATEIPLAVANAELVARGI
ncbi:hypothetical protein D3C75_704130 [compost metagenome]